MYSQYFGRGDDTVGNPHRAQISRFELFELILLLKLDKLYLSQQVPPPLLTLHSRIPPEETPKPRRDPRKQGDAVCITVSDVYYGPVNLETKSTVTSPTITVAGRKHS